MSRVAEIPSGYLYLEIYCALHTLEGSGYYTVEQILVIGECTCMCRR